MFKVLNNSPQLQRYVCLDICNTKEMTKFRRFFRFSLLLIVQLLEQWCAGLAGPWSNHDTVDMLIEPNSDMLDVEDTQPFLTSTPILDKGHTSQESRRRQFSSVYTSALKKQPAKCEECPDMTLCTVCLIKQYLQNIHEESI